MRHNWRQHYEKDYLIKFKKDWHLHFETLLAPLTPEVTGYDTTYIEVYFSDLFVLARHSVVCAEILIWFLAGFTLIFDFIEINEDEFGYLNFVFPNKG